VRRSCRSIWRRVLLPHLSRGRATLELAATLAALAFGCAPALALDVAVLKSSDVPTWRPTLEALQRTVAGHTLTEYDLRGDRAAGAAVIKGIKGRPGVLVAMGPLAAQLARELLPEIPLVFCMVQDPAQIGITPGPGVTGVAFGIPARNQLAAFRVVYPNAVRVGVLYTPGNTSKLVEEAEKAALVVRMLLVTKPITTEKEIPSALRALVSGADAVDAVWLIPDPLLLSEESRRHILSETLNAGKPTFSFSAALVSEGALISSGPDPTSIGEKAGELVGRIAAGEKRIDMLVPRAELVVNTKVAGKLKIQIPPEVLKSARVY
jgi:putative ABC transport system substrate-binding protein